MAAVKKSVSVKDVARLAGVSEQTVSRTVHDSPSVRPETKERVRAAMSDMAEEIGRITAERVQGELDKLIAGKDPAKGIDLMVDTGLADIVYPEISALKLTQDEHRQHKDV